MGDDEANITIKKKVFKNKSLRKKVSSDDEEIEEDDTSFRLGTIASFHCF